MHRFTYIVIFLFSQIYCGESILTKYLTKYSHFGDSTLFVALTTFRAIDLSILLSTISLNSLAFFRQRILVQNGKIGSGVNL